MTQPVVEILVNGPGGSVTIYVPSPADWDAQLPWAAPRREAVFDLLAREVRRRKGPRRAES